MAATVRFVVGAVLAVLLSSLFAVDVHAQTPATRVVLLAADSTPSVADVTAKLVAQALDVTVIDVGVGTTAPTPTRDELLAYQAVLTWSHSTRGYADPTGLGNALAAYVDAGGGVVQAVYSLSRDMPFRLDGRWRTGAYEPFTLPTTSAVSTGFYLNMSQVLPTHPIMSGVPSFSGGGSSFHYQVQPQGCAETIALWSNGRVLVDARVGPRGGRIVGLNMYPVSDSVPTIPAFANWDHTTGGARMMANALRFAASPAPAPPVGAPVVALVGSTPAPWLEDVRCKVQDSRLFSQVDAINVSSTTPSLATLGQYDAVLTWSDLPYQDSTALGNVLADYADAHHGVVEAATSFVPGFDLGGRWGSGGYRPFTEGPLAPRASLSLVPVISGHEILQGVSSVRGGSSSYHSAPVTFGSASTLVANWTDGQPLVAVGSGPTGSRIVGLNFFPPSGTVRGDLWDPRSDGGRLMANALLNASNRYPSANAGPDQMIEATSPSGVSFTIHGTGSDLDGDPITFEWSGAAVATGANITLDAPPPTAPSTSQTYTMTLTVSDGKGGITTDSVDLTVTDTTAPVLSGVPTGPIDLVATGAAGALLTFGPVTASDAVDGDRPVVCTPASSSMLPVGAHVVKCMASDTRGNTSSASFNVTVTDTTAPVLSGVPVGPLNLEATGPGGALLTFGPVTAFDPVDGDRPVICTPASSSMIPIGTTVVTCTASDSHGNTSSASFSVTVTDTTAPVLSGVPVGPIELEATGPGGALLTFGPVTASDVVDGDRAVICTPASSSMIPVGTTVVTCTASDSHGNSSSAGFNVTVTDTTAPVLSGMPVGPINLVATGPGGAQLTFGPVTAFDVVDGNRPVTCAPASSSMIPVGTTVVTCTASDSHGNTSSAGFNVTVTDTTAPVLSGMPVGPINLVATGPGGAELTFGPVTAFDVVDGNRPVTCAPASSSMFPVGTTVVTCTASDSHGNTSSAGFNVTVTDTTAPVLSGVPVGPINLVATGPGGALLTFGPVTAFDIVDGNRPVTCAPASSSMIPVGTTVVTCTASDSHGNTSSASFNATVTAPPPPVDPPVPPVDPATPGWVFGDGFIRDDDMRYEFKFRAVKAASGPDRGGLVFTVKSGYSTEQRPSRRRHDEFVSRTVESVSFDGDSGVFFTGTGRWNGRDGYSYEVSAGENSLRLRRDDIVAITIKSSDGTVVGQVNGRLGGGDVQFFRRPY